MSEIYDIFSNKNKLYVNLVTSNATHLLPLASLFVKFFHPIAHNLIATIIFRVLPRKLTTLC